MRYHEQAGATCRPASPRDGRGLLNLLQRARPARNNVPGPFRARSFVLCSTAANASQATASPGAFLKILRAIEVHVRPHHQGQGRQDGEGPRALQGLEGQLPTLDWPASQAPQETQGQLQIRWWIIICHRREVPPLQDQGYKKRKELFRVAFFPTIDDDDWVEHSRLAPFLPRDAAGNADDSYVPDFIAMLRELLARNAEECKDLGKKPEGSKDTLFDASIASAASSLFDMLLGGTHGCRPPERMEMRWTNTFFKEHMDLSRGAQQQFNQQQLAAGQFEIPLNPCHAHKFSLTREDQGQADRAQSDAAQCILGSQSRLLFIAPMC
ncbi:hypothetical protein WJX84_005143 [Apatococcus fuscideae]|uniref:Uncharacterized protein n=1 Tax=Apatococcus fuscideae TaxID=2026836 RepID=A0AAW1RNK0_9CHLO